MPAVSWSQEAVEQLAALGAVHRREMHAIVERVRRFGRGDAVDLKKLRGSSGRWRIRHGDWRVILDARDDGTFSVAEVRPRRDAYDD